MLNQTREAIYSGLLQWIKTAAGNAFTTYSRRVLLWDQIPQEQRPALVQIERGEDYVQDSPGQPPKVTLDVLLMIVADTKVNVQAGSEPITVLNPLIDVVDSALRPDQVSWQQTLGGLVYECWIDGRIEKSSGDLDGDAVAIIPVKLIVPA